jgi:hypothetical protein
MDGSTPTGEESLGAMLKEFLARPGVVRVVSIVCWCAAVPFLGVAGYFFDRHSYFWMWCNVFWCAFLIAAGFFVRHFGIQRTLALSLLLVALIFMGTAGVWFQLNNPLIAGFNIFWMIVCMALAFVINPRRA